MGRGYSYSPSPPPRSYRGRARSPSPRGRYGSHGRDLPTSLLVRNLRRDCRPEDLRRPFGQFGRLKDIYIFQEITITQILKSTVEEKGRNRELQVKEICNLKITVEEKGRNRVTGLREMQVMKSTREPRGFGFVQYYDPEDAADAKYYMDGQVVLGREVAVVFAEENRKKPSEMRARDRVSSRGRSYDRRYPCSRSLRYSPSPRGRSLSRSRSYSRSPSPRYAKQRLREKPYSRSPVDSRSRSRPLEEQYDRSTRERGPFLLADEAVWRFRPTVSSLMIIDLL